MCESKVYVQERGEKRVVMDEAAKIIVDNKYNKIKIYGILGNLEEVEDCEIDVIDLMKHEIVLKRK